MVGCVKEIDKVNSPPLRPFLRFAAVLAVCWQVSFAGAATLTFDELPFQPVDGLSFQGVTFGFTVDGSDSTEAYYHSFGPGQLETVQDPSLAGDATGVLTLDFDLPTPDLQFGVALNTADALSPGFRVELFDASLVSIGIISVDTPTAADPLGFSEALFEHSGTPIRRAVIDFADGLSSFGLDNLAYVQIPEPSTVALLCLGLVLFAFHPSCSSSSRARCTR